MFSSGFFILSRILFFRFIYPEFSVISSFVSAVKCIARFFLSVSTYLALPQTCIKSGFFGTIGRNADKSQTVPISVLLFRKELTERRKKHSVFRISRFRINTGFCRTKLTLRQEISSQARYDRFDTAPYMFNRCFSSLFFGEKRLWKELTERTANYSIFEPGKPRMVTKFWLDETDNSPQDFESSSLRPLWYVSIW